MKKIIVRSLGVLFLMMVTFAVNAQDGEMMISNWKVKLQGSQLLMHWSADASKSVGIFEVQSSSDGAHFQTMAYIFGPDPKSNGLDYACKAEAGAEDEIAYFRIKYTDDKGNVETGSIMKFNKRPQG